MANGGIIGPINDPTKTDLLEAFTSPGTFTSPIGATTGDLLIVAGGGGSGSGAAGVTLTGADETVYLAKTVSVPADATLVILDTPIYLMEGDILKGGASAAGDLDLFVSYDVIS